jgi:hypothetical protein
MTPFAFSRFTFTALLMAALLGAQAKPAEDYTLPLSIVRNGTTGVIDIKRLGMMSVLNWTDKSTVRLVARNVDPQLGKDAVFKLQVNSAEVAFTYDAGSKTLWAMLKKEQLPSGANTLRVTFVDKGDKKMVSSPTLAWMVN